MLFVLAQHFVPSSWQSSVCQPGFELLKQPIDGLSQTTRQSQFQEKVPDSVLPHDEDPGWDGIEEELANITRPSKAAARLSCRSGMRPQRPTCARFHGYSIFHLT